MTLKYSSYKNPKYPNPLSVHRGRKRPSEGKVIAKVIPLDAGEAIADLRDNGRGPGLEVVVGRL